MNFDCEVRGAVDEVWGRMDMDEQKASPVGGKVCADWMTGDQHTLNWHKHECDAPASMRFCTRDFDRDSSDSSHSAHSAPFSHVPMLQPSTTNEKPSTPSTPKHMTGKNMDVDDKRVEEETRVIVGALV